MNNVWVDTTLLDLSKYQYRFYKGINDQQPDSLIEAINGIGKTSAYRDICYIIFENFPLSEFNNRIPNFLFEVTRKNEINSDNESSLENCIKGINFALCAGEYVYDCSIQYKAREQFDPYELETAEGIWYQLNNNNNSKIADGLLSLNQFFEEFKNCEFVAPQIAFFGNSLDAGICTIEPRVEFNIFLLAILFLQNQMNIQLEINGIDIMHKCLVKIQMVDLDSMAVQLATQVYLDFLKN